KRPTKRKGGGAPLANLRPTLRNQLLNQQSQQANVEFQFQQAQLDLEANQELSKKGLIASILLKKSQLTAQERGDRNEMGKKKLQANSDSADAQISAQQSRVDQFRGVYELRRRQVELLNV